MLSESQCIYSTYLQNVKEITKAYDTVLKMKYSKVLDSQCLPNSDAL